MRKVTKTALGVLPMLIGLALTACNKGVDNSTLVIGLECNYAPFNWTEASENDFTLPISNHNGSYADGYDIQIAKLLSEDLGKPVKIIETQWTSLIADLQLGSINCVIAGMTDTEERRKSIDFTDEYYRSELVLVTSKTVADTYSTVVSQSDFTSFISGKVVVSQTETVTDDMIDLFAETYGAIHASPVSSFALAATDVSNGSAFAMTAEYPVAQSIIKSFSNLGIVHIDQNILGESQADLGVSIGIKKGNTELEQALNASLAKISSETRTALMIAAVDRSGE